MSRLQPIYQFIAGALVLVFPLIIAEIKNGLYRWSAILIFFGTALLALTPTFRGKFLMTRAVRHQLLLVVLTGVADHIRQYARGPLSVCLVLLKADVFSDEADLRLLIAGEPYVLKSRAIHLPSCNHMIFPAPFEIGGYACFPIHSAHPPNRIVGILYLYTLPDRRIRQSLPMTSSFLAFMHKCCHLISKIL